MCVRCRGSSDPDANSPLKIYIFFKCSDSSALFLNLCLVWSTRLKDAHLHTAKQKSFCVFIGTECGFLPLQWTSPVRRFNRAGLFMCACYEILR